MSVPYDRMTLSPNERNTMPVFTVTMREVSEWSMNIEADSEEKAKDIAENTHIDEWISVDSDFEITSVIPN